MDGFLLKVSTFILVRTLEAAFISEACDLNLNPDILRLLWGLTSHFGLERTSRWRLSELTSNLG